MRTDGGAGTSPARNGGSLPCHMLRAPLLALYLNDEQQTELGTLSTDPTGVPDHVNVVKRGGGSPAARWWTCSEAALTTSVPEKQEHTVDISIHKYTQISNSPDHSRVLQSSHFTSLCSRKLM